ASPDLPSGWSADVNLNFQDGTVPPGLHKIRVTLSTTATSLSMPANGHLPIVYLNATVPATAPIGGKEVLDLSAGKVFDNVQPLNGFTARDNDGVHVSAYFGDVEGDKDHDSQDTTRVRQVGVRLEEDVPNDIFPGFAASGPGQTSFQLADPALLSDI